MYLYICYQRINSTVFSRQYWYQCVLDLSQYLDNKSNGKPIIITAWSSSPISATRWSDQIFGPRNIRFYIPPDNGSIVEVTATMIQNEIFNIGNNDSVVVDSIFCVRQFIRTIKWIPVHGDLIAVKQGATTEWLKSYQFLLFNVRNNAG